jgi:2-keto-4-pentenoate hydratase
VALHADAAVAIELRAEVPASAGRARIADAIAGYGAALEIVDLGSAGDPPEAIVASNVFHRAFALGGLGGDTLARSAAARMTIDGSTAAHAPVTQDHVDLVHATAVLLEAVGLRLEAGDRLITGSVVQVAIAPGDAVVADLGPLGRVELRITTAPPA